MTVIAPIVEGHGEMSAVPELVRRIAYEMHQTPVQVVRPFRLDAGKMRHPEQLLKAVRFQAERIQAAGGVLILRDGDDADVDCPVNLAVALRSGHHSSTQVPVEVVIAWREFEAWFLAGLESLRSHPAILNDALAPTNPEGYRDAKGVLRQQMNESYKETLHQVRFAALLDISLAMKRSRSFLRMVHAVECLLYPPIGP